MTLIPANIIQSCQLQAEKDLKELKRFLKLPLESPEIDEKIDPVLVIDDRIQEEEKFDDDIIDIQPNYQTFSRGRMLLSAGDCVNSGVFTQASVNIYTCDGDRVSKAIYNSRNGAGCTVQQSTENVCYCPFDFYGDRCETFNSYSCSIDRINYPAQCSGPDSHRYVYSYDGSPPCHYVDEGQTITMT